MALLITDPVCLELDDNHDLIVPLRHARGVTAVRQGIHSRIKLIKGECMYNIDEGVAWKPSVSVAERDAILGQTFNEQRARTELRKAILATPGTLPASLVMNLVYDRSTRALAVEYEVRTVFGDTVADALTIGV